MLTQRSTDRYYPAGFSVGSRHRMDLAIKSGDGIPNEHGHNPTGFEVAL